MADPLVERDQLDAALELAATRAREYLQDVRDQPVLSPDTEVAIERWHDPMPEEGDGTLAALEELADRGRETATRSSGPRFFHFVMGGGTPAALAADWLTSAYDQPAYAWASSPFAARLEQVVVQWLRQLFELPGEFGGVLTTGATMANFVALAAARNRWAERHGVDCAGGRSAHRVPAPEHGDQRSRTGRGARVAAPVGLGGGALHERVEAGSARRITRS